MLSVLFVYVLYFEQHEAQCCNVTFSASRPISRHILKKETASVQLNKKCFTCGLVSLENDSR